MTKRKTCCFNEVAVTAVVQCSAQRLHVPMIRSRIPEPRRDQPHCARLGAVDHLFLELRGGSAALELDATGVVYKKSFFFVHYYPLMRRDGALHHRHHTTLQSAGLQQVAIFSCPQEGVVENANVRAYPKKKVFFLGGGGGGGGCVHLRCQHPLATTVWRT